MDHRDPLAKLSQGICVAYTSVDCLLSEPIDYIIQFFSYSFNLLLEYYMRSNVSILTVSVVLYIAFVYILHMFSGHIGQAVDGIHQRGASVLHFKPWEKP